MVSTKTYHLTHHIFQLERGPHAVVSFEENTIGDKDRHVSHNPHGNVGVSCFLRFLM